MLEVEAAICSFYARWNSQLHVCTGAIAYSHSWNMKIKELTEEIKIADSKGSKVYLKSFALSPFYSSIFKPWILLTLKAILSLS